MKVGTGIFNYKGKCLNCGEKTLIDINGFCRNCYLDDIVKEQLRLIKKMKEGLK